MAVTTKITPLECEFNVCWY